MSKPYQNKQGSYEIFIVSTGEVIEKCRLKATTTERLAKLKSIIKKELGIRKVE